MAPTSNSYNNDCSNQDDLSAPDGSIELFVPGRICLFGEHSDWAGGFRRVDSTIPVGKCLLSGTNQGLYARVSKNHSDPNLLVLKATFPSQGKAPQNNKTNDHEDFHQTNQTTSEVEIPMDDEDLWNHAVSEGSIWCYICGVTYQLKKAFPDLIRGIVIDNYKTTLPVKKGLSSSAAVCVLTVRAFNHLFNLNLSTRQEMEFAYLGETTTPSKCGRMDQGCAFGVKPILMTFDGDDLHVDENVPIGGPIHLILVDLCASKNTPAILNDLQKAFPNATCPITKGVQTLLGPINHAIMDEALEALQKGCAQSIGAIMCRAQKEFDTYAIPASPEHLTSPVLHTLLKHERLQPHVYGGKGVGSQGDGSAQFVVKSLEDQQAAIEIIENDFGMTSLSLSLGV